MRLRPFQRQALEILQKPGHLICVSPTGSGKSLIFERAIRENRWKTLILSPLVALCRQQRARLSEAGIDVGSETRILSPESLLSEARFEEIRRWRPDFIVVDECHCVWDWGERFRPAFSEIPSWVRRLQIQRSLWLTATLPPDARADLRARLQPPVREIGTFALPDSLTIRPVQVAWRARADALLTWLRAQTAPGIVFAPTRALTLRLAALADEAAGPGRQVIAYHAGLSREERLALEARIERGEIHFVFATSAFGMGLHHPRFAWTVLWQAPPSLLLMAQFLGRAARDPNRAATGLIFWDDEDFGLQEWMLHGSRRKRQDLLAVQAFLRSPECRRIALSRYFNDNDAPALNPTCMRCDICLSS